MAKDFQIVVDDMTFDMQMPNDPTTEELAYFQRERDMAAANASQEYDRPEALFVVFLRRSMSFAQYLRFCDQMIAAIEVHTKEAC